MRVSKQISVEELIASIDEDANEPDAWIRSAACLLHSSDVLKHHRELVGSSEPLRAVSSRNVERMLDGFAFENLLKAVAAKNGIILYSGGRKKKLASLKSHDLVAHAKWAGLVLSDGETSYLNALSDVMMGIGRYPFRLSEIGKRGATVWMPRPYASAKSTLLARILEQLHR